MYILSKSITCLDGKAYLIVDIMQTAGALGGLAASLIRVPTEVSNIVFPVLDGKTVSLFN